MTEGTRYNSEQAPDPRPGFYYVTATRDGGAHFALICGPFEHHVDALDDVARVRSTFIETDSRAHWYAWGTCRMLEKPKIVPPIARLL